MPALIYFQRKWLVACDDLVIPYAMESIVRTLWLCATSVIVWLEHENIHNSLYIMYFIYTYLGDLIVTSLLGLGISITSSKGSVLEVHKRRHLVGFLYAKFMTDFVDLGLACYLIWIFSFVPNLSGQLKSFCEVVCVSLWIYVFIMSITYFLIYNSLGSPKYWEEHSKTDSAKLMKKVERIWRFRLKFFCCCADVSGDGNDFIYVEIANFLATFSNDIQLAPTDILAGLVTLSRKHAIERRKMKYQENMISSSLLENKATPSWMTAENAIAYLRIAKSTYGWLAFFDTLRPWQLCSLLSPRYLLCSTGNAKHGDCCGCNTTALERISGLPESDILYASFSNSIHEPAFTVTFHHDLKSVVVAIRGTRSISDLITDIDAEEMSFPSDVSSLKINFHRGALRSSLFVYKTLNKLNVLKWAFAEHPSYTLVLTGHSLGGSIASILGLLLQKEHPSLQCYAYGPLPVISVEGMAKMTDFVFSVVVGDDMVPRLSVPCCKELFRQLHKSLEETRVPKYKILAKAFLPSFKKSLKMSPKVLAQSEVYENPQMRKEECPTVQVNVAEPVEEVQLYAPGRILHLKKSQEQGCDYCWTTGFSFQNLIVNPRMIRDHQPRQIQAMLDAYKTFISSLEKEKFCIRL